MNIYNKVDKLQESLRRIHRNGKKIAFVPTMGALHQGHLSLIRHAREISDFVICSIFVNPTQFNNNEDLKKYPRTLEEDKKMLLSAHCDLLFVPEISDIYPDGTSLKPELQLNGVDLVMEGKFRPGHFAGMLQVVKRLLDIVQPDFLIMGQKDFQQYSLVAMMIKQLNLPCNLVVSLTVREEDGLAMSSRNRRLDPDFRKKSAIIYKALQFAHQNINKLGIEELCSTCSKMIDEEGLRTEYFEIVDSESLQPIKYIAESEKIAACVACWAGDVRLIDNLILKE
ncbi:MAG: pantoate--beta-alanine ligase [Saprospiraceae bacterium]